MKQFRILHGVAVLTAVWYAAAVLIRSPIIPQPHLVALQTLQDLSRPATMLHLASSLYRILAGLALALTTGVPTGIAAARSRLFGRSITPLLYLLYPVPKIALLPVFMVLLGIGDAAKIALIAVIIFFPIAVAVRDGVQRISARYMELVRVLHLTQREILGRIILPGILPDIFSALRISLGISLSVLFFSENIATGYGLGFLIMNSWIMADYLGMYAGIVLLSSLGVMLYRLLDILQNKLMPWTSS
ncbi:ABC transporter permease [Spirochaeta africana]|uniref:ABC-type nitrate/sulfonate/bicarbonate transport system, permease component n=1 Tax=Spirochaeta africana (strain ATCC 700263 / DSM 8902 / Z-7692) TaxID=889378 RepID=H9UK61_SPIAZ|nr:ABC transporter permease [Spirochaeta africana]AFG37904.1 ABC-type nitrate/sulfonate/bicarbonate transport system, permease component [Spirochaeta africana DSM 8902]